MYSQHLLHGLAGDPVNGNGAVVNGNGNGNGNGTVELTGDDLTSFFEDPEVQRGFRMAGAAFAPVSGFLWGALVGLVVGPSGGRGAAAVDAGLYGALTNFAQSAICIPDSMQSTCQYTNWIPATTIVSGYVAYQHRTGERG